MMDADINYLGGLWYSKGVMGKNWMVTAYMMAYFVSFAGAGTLLYGMMVGAMCWLGFAGPTSLANTLFHGKPPRLWAIDTGNNLIAFMIAGGILALWK